MEKELIKRQKYLLISKELFIMGSPRLFMMSKMSLYKPDLQRQFSKFCIKYPAYIFWLLGIILSRLSCYFETDTKIYILKVISPNLIEEKYLSIGDLSVNTHWTSKLSIVQIKVIFVRNILMSK